MAIWNTLGGVVPVKKFKNSARPVRRLPKTAVSRIWVRIRGLGEAAKPAAESAKPNYPFSD